MNIFVLDDVPSVAAHYMCDKHVPKMCVESAQMMASALRRHGVGDSEMPHTKNGTPYKGGYHNHPCTRWTGDARANFKWLTWHAIELCREFQERFKKVHKCTMPIIFMAEMEERIPDKHRTPFAQAMPEQYKHPTNAVKAYRNYYINEKPFAKWRMGNTPHWWVEK